MFFISLEIIDFILEFFSILKKFINLEVSLVEVVSFSFEFGGGCENLFLHFFNMVLQVIDFVALVVDLLLQLIDFFLHHILLLDSLFMSSFQIELNVAQCEFQLFDVHG